MKKCYRCKREKNSQAFYADRSKSDGLSGECKECNHKRSLERKKTPRGKESHRKYMANYNARVQQLKDKNKEACVLCGYRKCKDALHFHHVRREDKELDLSDASSINQVMKEINKCIVLCANCHAEVHSRTHRTPVHLFVGVEKQYGLFA